MTYDNLKRIYEQADATDRREGKLAYERYHYLLWDIAVKYDFPFERVVAAFAALSPNNDYWGNLRSLVSVLHGINEGIPCEAITISTYGHCRDRAHAYLLGASDFVKTVRGPKIRAFYFNILDPLDRAHVTIDGHMVAAYRANTGTMKENIVRKREYEEVARACKRLASYMNLIPNQLQATIWFARKRILNIKFDPQLDLFAGVDNAWKTVVDINSIKPY